MKFRIVCFCCCFFASFQVSVFSQNLDFVRKTVKLLASEKYQGRGYTNNGERKAADYIASKYKNIGLKPYKTTYFQEFPLTPNTFAGNMMVKLDGKEIQPVLNFLPAPYSGGGKGSFPVEWLTGEIAEDSIKLKAFRRKNHTTSFIAIDTSDIKNKKLREKIFIDLLQHRYSNAGLLLQYKEKLLHSLAEFNTPYVFLYIDSALSKNTKAIEIDIDNNWIEDYKARNIIGYIPGKTDSAIVLTAHFDHLGNLGKNIFFAGAHDNASGTAMLLDMASYFSKMKEKPYYTMVFMCFSGEEIGLCGSKYYTENPFFPLSSIKFLLNLDMVSTGEDGIMVVNGKVHTARFNRLKAINDSAKYVAKIDARGAAANSDHYFFHKNKVPCFYIYTLGTYSYYHLPEDTHEKLRFSAYNNLFHLLVHFFQN